MIPEGTELAGLRSAEGDEEARWLLGQAYEGYVAAWRRGPEAVEAFFTGCTYPW